MSREKQIEEMRKEVARIHRFFLEDDDYESLDEYIADMLFDKGYRKSQDVAREIFEEIEKEIELAIESNYRAKKEHKNHSVIPNYDNFNAMCDGKIYAMRGLLDFMEELKKKYIGEDINVTTTTEEGK